MDDDDSEFDDSLSAQSQFEEEMSARGVNLGGLNGREAIHQATGIIMVRRGYTRAGAVDYLLDQAEVQRRDLHDVALQIVESLTIMEPFENDVQSTPARVTGGDVEIVCEGCGELVVIPEPLTVHPRILRERRGEAAGRVTIYYLNKAIHRCKPETFVPPDQVAPRR